MAVLISLIMGFFSLLAFVVLTSVGIRRGLRCELVIFSGWGDFALTCILVLFGVGSIPILIRDSSMVVPILSVGTTLGLLWSVLTFRNTHQVSELWFSVPCKLSLASVVILGTLFAISCAHNALKEKATPSERLKNGALAVGASLLVSKAIDLSRKLIRQASHSADTSPIRKGRNAPPSFQPKRFLR